MATPPPAVLNLETGWPTETKTSKKFSKTSHNTCQK